MSITAFIYYPFYLVLFWYKDVLGGLLEFFFLFNRYFSSLLSLPLLFRTFFKPLKNEYRDGLVLFSIIFGMVVKTFLISVSLLVYLFVVMSEFVIGTVLICLPPVLVFLLFGKI